MKNNFIRNNRFQALWIAIHSIIFVMMAILFLCGKRFKINTNLFDILPQSNNSREVSKADSVLSSKTGRMFIVLVKAQNLERAKSGAKKFVSLLQEDSENEKNKNNQSIKKFEEISYEMDSNIVSEISDYFFRNRYFLLDENHAEKLFTEEGITEFIDDVNLNIYNGWSSIDNLDKDPFVLGDIELWSVMDKLVSNGTAMKMTDGVLSTYYKDNCYVMVRGVLTAQGASITNKNSGVKKIYEVCKQIDEAEFIFSGVPFHSYESSTSAQFEISLISTVSLILIILICILIFKNGIPVICSVGAILMSAVTALCSVLLVFGEIHILTFVFGTTLIGTCLDYSVHYFVRWKGDCALNDGEQIRKKLFKGLSLSLISTEVCYLLLIFSPFTLLKQVAVFSFAGILSSYLTSICLYPKIKICIKRELGFNVSDKIKILQNIFKFDGKRKLIFKKLFLLVIVSIFIVSAFVFRKNIRIDNNLKTFYSMKGKLLENESEVNSVLNPGTNGCYFIVKGKSKEEVLNTENLFVKKLEEYKAQKENRLFNYNCVTKYVPSEQKQKKSYDSIKQLIPYLKTQYLSYGLDNEEASFLTDKFIRDYQENESNFIDVEDLPDFIKSAVSTLWIGQVDEDFYSVVMPMHFKSSEEMKMFCENFENVYFVNKISDVSNELNKLTKVMLGFLVTAFIIMMIILKLFYEWKKAFKIIVIPVITVLSCVSVLALANVPLGFFSVTGIILVFGLSIDYIIYAVEDSEKLNSVAIELSFISSALSFGALALSSFAPVFMFGLSVFAGLTTAVICTMLIKE